MAPTPDRSGALGVRIALRRYGAAVILWAVAFGLTLELADVARPALFLFLHLAVLVSACYGGLGPGLVTGVLSLITADFLFFPPLGAFHLHSPADGLLLATFLLVALIASGITQRMRSARRIAEEHAHQAADLTVELEQQVDETRQLLHEIKESNAHLETLRRTAERASYRLQRLYDVVTAMSEALSVDDVAEAILLEVQVAIGARVGALGLLTPDGSALELVRSIGLPAEIHKRWQRIPLESRTPLTDAARTRSPVFIESAAERAERYPELERVRTVTQSGAQVAVPLEAKGRALGAVTFSMDEAGSFTDEERAFVLALARQCSQALERARLHHSATTTAQHLRVVLENAADAIIIFDERGAIESVNPAAGRIFGYAVEEMIGRDLVTILPEPAGAADGGRIARFMAAEEPHASFSGHEMLGRRNGGGEFPVGVAMSATPTPERRLFTAIVRDITEQMHGEDQLREAKENAEEASRVKSRFLAVMSHELRTPLNAILGYQDLLDGEVAGPINDRQREHLRRIRGSAWHLLQLIDEILSLSRIEEGKETVRIENFDLGPLVRDTVALIEPQAADRGLELRVLAPAVPLRLDTDPGKVRQVLLNLLSNALKFTEAGAIEVRVAPDGGDRILVHVRDTGIGIAAENLATIFEPFQQVDQSATRRKGGTGLGLAVSRQLASLLGGDLIVQSEPGRGSTFTLGLPFSPKRQPRP